MGVSSIAFSGKQSLWSVDQAKDVYKAINTCQDVFPSTPSYLLFSYLLERIYRYHKHADWVYNHHFDEGVYDGKTGERIQAPCLVRKTARSKAYKALEALGLITRRYSQKGRLFVELHPEKVVKLMASKLKLSKKRANKGENTTEDTPEYWSKNEQKEGETNNVGLVRETNRGSSRNEHISDRLSKSGKSKSSSKTMSAEGRRHATSEVVVKEDPVNQAPCPLPDVTPASPALTELANALTRVEIAAAARDEKARQRANNQTVPTKKVFQAMWRASIRANQERPYAEVLSAKDWGSFTQSIKSLPDTVQISQIVDWSTSNWACTVYTAMFWTHRYTNTIHVQKTPSMAFFCRYFGRIVKLYAEHSNETKTLLLQTYKDFQPKSDNSGPLLRQALEERDYYRSIVEKEDRDHVTALRDQARQEAQAEYKRHHDKRLAEQTPEELAEWEKGAGVTADLWDIDDIVNTSWEDAQKKSGHNSIIPDYKKAKRRARLEP